MSLFPNISAIFLDTIVSGLIPWLLTAAGGDASAAREATLLLLASYDVETEEELRLAAEITSYGLSALDALSRSVNPDLSLGAVLRLRGSANTAQRSKNQCQRVLDRLRKERRLDVAPAETQPPAEQVATDAPVPTGPEFHLSRQQRRAVERAVVKTQRKLAEKERLKSMRNTRAGTAPAVPVSAREAQNQSLAA